MEIASSTSLYIWLIESLFLLWLSSLIIIKKQYKIPLARFMLAFFSLASLGAALWAIPALVSTNQLLLTTTSIVGDALFMSGVAFTWLSFWYIFLKPRGVNLLFVLVPLIIYVTALSIISGIITINHPPYHRGDEYVNYINLTWQIFYTLLYLPLPVLGIYFLGQAHQTTDPIQKFRAYSWGFVHLAIGIVVLSTIVASFDTRNVATLIVLSIFIILTLFFTILQRIRKA